jgi:hypothetical protein
LATEIAIKGPGAIPNKGEDFVDSSCAMRETVPSKVSNAREWQLNIRRTEIRQHIKYSSE